MKEHTKDLNAFQEKVKRDVEKYVKNTYLNLEKQKALLERWENTPEELEDAELQYFNANAARKMIQMWDIIMNVLPAAKRNLLLIGLACDNNTEMVVKYFDGHFNGGATVRAQMSRARRIVRELYEEKYGKHDTVQNQ